MTAGPTKGASIRLPFFLVVFLLGFVMPGYLVMYVFHAYPAQAYSIIMTTFRPAQSCASVQQFVATSYLAWSVCRRGVAFGVSCVMLQSYAFSLVTRALTTRLRFRCMFDCLSALLCIVVWLRLRRSPSSQLSKDAQSFWGPLLMTLAISLSFDMLFTGWWHEMLSQDGLFEAFAQLVYQWAHWMDGVAIVAQCRMLARERGAEWFVLFFVIQMFLARATLSSAWLAVFLDRNLWRAVGLGKIVASCWCNFSHIGALLFVASLGWPRQLLPFGRLLKI